MSSIYLVVIRETGFPFHEDTLPISKIFGHLGATGLFLVCLGIRVSINTCEICEYRGLGWGT